MPGLPETQLRGERRGFGEAAGQGAGGPRGTEQCPGGVRRRGLGSGRGAGGRSASPTEGGALWWPQSAGRPGGEQGVMTASAEGRPG